MSERVRSFQDDGGRLVARKTALDAHEHPRLEREASILRAARHPGIVRIVAATDGHIDLEWTGGRTLATHPPATAGETAAAMAGLAATVADLHQMGVTHGALQPEHVLLDPAGRPVLCSFSKATQVDTLLDPDHHARTTEDVRALGHMLDRFVGDLPTRRSLSWSARRQRRRLLEQATHAASLHSPSARALAASLSDIASPQDHVPRPRERAGGQAHLLDTHEPATSDAYDLAVFDRLRPVEEPLDARRRRPVPGAVAVVPLLLVLAGVLLFTSRRADDTAERPVEVTIAADQGAEVTSSATSAPHEAAGPACDAPTRQLEPASLRTDIDGDGCTDVLTIEGNLVTAGPRRWEVGEPGDLIAIADWDCDGGATPALLRTHDGALFVFDTWAPPHGTIDAAHLTTVPDATRIATDHRTCPDLVVTRADGTMVHVPVPEEETP